MNFATNTQALNEILNRLAERSARIQKLIDGEDITECEYFAMRAELAEDVEFWANNDESFSGLTLEFINRQISRKVQRIHHGIPLRVA